MAISGADKTLNALYAGLDHAERSRLLAKLHRRHDVRELERLRRTIPDTAAGAAYNRAVGILRQLHGWSPAMLLAIGLGIDRDVWMLSAGAERAIRRRRSLGNMLRLWRIAGYPVTASEYAAVVRLERSEPESLDDYAEWLAEFEGSEPGLNPAVASLLARLPADLRRNFGAGESEDGADLEDDVRRAREIAGQIRKLMDAAVRRGDLPKPRRTKDGFVLPRGRLKDWGEGTTSGSFAPLPPSYHVPSLELVGGDLAAWDVRPDSEAGTVMERRRDLLELCRALAIEVCGPDEVEILDGIEIEPPDATGRRSGDEMRGARTKLWGSEKDRAWMRAVVRGHALRRAELRAHNEVIAAFEASEFGGEDPLDPIVRELLDKAAAAGTEFEELWTNAVSLLWPDQPEDVDARPPSLDADGYLEQLIPQLRDHLLGDWDA